MNSMIIAAAGQGHRMGAGKNKLLLKTGGRPLIWYTLHNMMKSRLLDEIILVIRQEERDVFEKLLHSPGLETLPVRLVTGGAARSDSVWNGLQSLNAHTEKVLIHDGARPLVGGDTADAVIRHIDESHPAVIPALASVDTIKKITARGMVEKTEDRTSLYRAQTPQGFLREPFQQAFKRCRERGDRLTDDASVMEKNGISVTAIPGRDTFFKVTSPEDWKRFEILAASEDIPFRIGQGYDIHRIETSRPLVLGGVLIAPSGGLAGHSDADVLIHAVMDALLGAAGLPDIGHWFPDTDPAYEGADSTVLLQRVSEILEENSWGIVNIDSTVLAEAPRLAPYIGRMKKTVALILGIDESRISIKATTHEGLGPVGKGRGMAAFASVLLYRRFF
jgi:2-C-methyl-D-erythritol 4-phosphate cytidylyltransferase/2-C-methyl-D-erythritol 2,4-cyclodiphosphate synthase